MFTPSVVSADILGHGGKWSCVAASLEAQVIFHFWEKNNHQSREVMKPEPQARYQKPLENMSQVIGAYKPEYIFGDIHFPLSDQYLVVIIEQAPIHPSQILISKDRFHELPGNFT